MERNRLLDEKKTVFIYVQNQGRKELFSSFFFLLMSKKHKSQNDSYLETEFQTI
jgi:hypothetical protein